MRSADEFGRGEGDAPAGQTRCSSPVAIPKIATPFEGWPQRPRTKKLETPSPPETAMMPTRTVVNTVNMAVVLLFISRSVAPR